MSAKIDLHGMQDKDLKHIWLSQAKKFVDHENDLREFIQAAHRWSDIWHATVWGMPDAAQQRGIFNPTAATRSPGNKRRSARANRQRFGKKVSARFPGTAGHRQR
jgi:hypothetical protein